MLSSKGAAERSFFVLPFIVFFGVPLMPEPGVARNAASRPEENRVHFRLTFPLHPRPLNRAGRGDFPNVCGHHALLFWRAVGLAR